MREEQKMDLVKRGWSKREISTAESILDKTQPHDVFFSKIVFWSALLVIVLGNILISFVAITFLVALNKFVLYAAIIVLAGMIGFLYNFLINDIGHLERKHHLLASVLVPILAFINLVVVVLIANGLIKDLNITNTPHNPWLLSIIFAIAFILPFIIDQIRLYFK